MQPAQPASTGTATFFIIFPANNVTIRPMIIPKISVPTKYAVSSSLPSRVIIWVFLARMRQMMTIPRKIKRLSVIRINLEPIKVKRRPNITFIGPANSFNFSIAERSRIGQPHFPEY